MFLKFARLGGLIFLFGGCATTAPFPARTLIERPPNVVLILADDQGWGDLRVHGNTNVETPHLDSLARDGALFERFYVQPVCSPTRAELLTGRYHVRSGVRGTDAGRERFDLGETTLPEWLKRAGYVTGAFGKWHSGGQHPYHPNARGLDEFYGYVAGHTGTYFDGPLDHNGSPTKGQGFLADDLTQHAIDFIDKNRDRPFFCFVPFNTPHSPMQVPDRHWRKFANAPLAMRGGNNEDLAHTRAALAMVENIDENVGRLLGRLDVLGLRENTVVIYMSDNGPNGFRWNGDMKGRKGSIDEGGLRVPSLWRWPGHIRAGSRVPEIAGAIDLLPTLAQLANISTAGGKPLDGVTLWPRLSGDRTPSDRKLLAFLGAGHGVGVRSQRFRLDGQARLFDMEADPGQRVDVASRLPAVASELKEATLPFVGLMRTLAAPDPRPFTIGHAALTHLSAGEGVASGGVQRSNRHPNSSYFLGWTATTGEVAWDVDVAAEGDYQVSISYACPASDVGATLEVSLGDRRLRTRLLQAHEAPLVGADQDRVPREESYVKAWGHLELGTMRLPKGRGRLVLRAPIIPGAQALELAAVSLRRR